MVWAPLRAFDTTFYGANDFKLPREHCGVRPSDNDIFGVTSVTSEIVASSSIAPVAMSPPAAMMQMVLASGRKVAETSCALGKGSVLVQVAQVVRATSFGCACGQVLVNQCDFRGSPKGATRTFVFIFQTWNDVSASEGISETVMRTSLSTSKVVPTTVSNSSTSPIFSKLVDAKERFLILT